MTMLFVENADSFSWNVIDRLPVDRADVHIVSGSDRELVLESLDFADVLVIGPGAGNPHRFDGLVELVSEAANRRLPTLGVSLGHQVLGLAFGARLVRGTPMVGKRSRITFDSPRLFPGFDGDLTVMRYHSVAMTDVKSPLRVVARDEDGTVMAVEHQELPMAGVQFHPDSYATERGEELFEAFFRVVR